ncbi:hypothetical protein D5S18_11325 [Nocardia panacis]|uniref:Uncharacterized protein n=1 Tax=Nocardia panacis TaxID=2340916 RepID=A0A3A4KAD7_9NOCA|nr:hypothetical protein [Nocardia panacis]RJO76820.1 hypothetical protein D5S18_11325 [Nocardia panacis]
MTDLETGVPASDDMTLDTLAGIDSTVSTPLRRAAGRLEAVLPPGWRVDVVDAPDAGESVLRVVMPEN